MSIIANLNPTASKLAFLSGFDISCSLGFLSLQNLLLSAGNTDSHILRMGAHPTFLGVTKVGLVPVKVVSLKRSIAGAFVVSYMVLGLEKSVSVCVCFRIGPSQGRKKFKPHPQNRILVLLRGSFQNFWQATLSFLYGSPPHPEGPTTLGHNSHTHPLLLFMRWA